MRTEGGPAARTPSPGRLVGAGLAAGWAASLLGFWLPWVGARPAALRFNGLDLAEWVTRLEAIRRGEAAAGPLSVLATLAGAALLGAASSALLRRTGPPGLAWPVLALSALSTAAILPGYPAIPGLLHDPEARGRAALAAGALLGVGLIAWPGRRLPARALCLLAALLGMGAGGLTLFTGAALRPELAALLPDLARPGPGLLLLLAGNGVAGLAGMLGAALPLPPSGRC